MDIINWVSSTNWSALLVGANWKEVLAALAAVGSISGGVYSYKSYQRNSDDKLTGPQMSKAKLVISSKVEHTRKSFTVTAHIQNAGFDIVSIESINLSAECQRHDGKFLMPLGVQDFLGASSTLETTRPVLGQLQMVSPQLKFYDIQDVAERVKYTIKVIASTADGELHEFESEAKTAFII